MRLKIPWRHESDKSPRTLRFEDIAIEVERTRWVEKQVAALHRIYREREALLAEELREKYHELREIDDDKEVIKRVGASIYDLSEQRKKYLILIQDEYISKYVARKLHALDDRRAREMIMKYNEALRLGEYVDLDEVLLLQEDLIKIGWTREDSKRPPVVVIQLPIFLEKGSYFVHREE